MTTNKKVLGGFTAGPWKVNDYDTYKNSLHIDADPKNGRPSIAEVLIMEKGHIEMEANAHLIASAPELLEACKEARKEIYEAINKRSNNLSMVWHSLNDAIAKAEGRE